MHILINYSRANGSSRIMLLEHASDDHDTIEYDMLKIEDREEHLVLSILQHLINPINYHGL